MHSVILKNIRFESPLALRVVRAHLRILEVINCEFLMSGYTSLEMILFEQTKFITANTPILFKDCIFDTRETYTIGYSFFHWKARDPNDLLIIPITFDNVTMVGSQYGPLEISLEGVQHLTVKDCTITSGAYFKLKDVSSVEIKDSIFTNLGLVFSGMLDNIRITNNVFKDFADLKYPNFQYMNGINICPDKKISGSILKNTFQNFAFERVNGSKYGAINFTSCTTEEETDYSFDVSWNDFSQLGDKQLAISNRNPLLMLDAKRNYYGKSGLGPHHCCNPNGTNIEVIGNITFFPWCCEGPPDGVCSDSGSTCGSIDCDLCAFTPLEPSSSGQLIVILVTVAISLVLLISGVITIYFFSRGKKPTEYDLLETQTWRSRLLANVENLQQLCEDFNITLIEYFDLMMDPVPIGSGSFGEVYQGTFKGNNVAIKKISNMYTDQFGGELEVFLEEIKIMVSIDHPNLLTLKGLSIHPESENLLLVTDLMTNGSLEDVIFRKQEKLDWDVKLSIATDIAYGMHYLHSKDPGIVHRDLKPGNVLLNEKWGAKVADFGIAKVLERKAATLTIKGTPIYLAPESIMKGKFSEKSDVFAYGITLIELYTEQRAYDDVEGESTSLMMMIATQGLRPTLSQQCPNEFKLLIEECVHQDPEQRPTFTQILEKLSEVRLKKSVKLKLKKK